MLRSIEEFYGTQHATVTIPDAERFVYDTAEKEFSVSSYRDKLQTQATVIFKMTMDILKTQETVYRLEKEAALGMLALGNQEEQKYQEIVKRSNEGMIRVQDEITRLELFQQKNIYESWDIQQFTENYGREIYAQYKINLAEARKHRNFQDKERKAEIEFNKIRDNLRKQRKHEVKKVQEGTSVLETLLKDYQSEVQRPTGKRASLIREKAAKIEVVLSEQVESYKRLEALEQISELKKNEQEKELTTFDETRAKIKALLAQTKELGFKVEIQQDTGELLKQQERAEVIEPTTQTHRSEIKIPINRQEKTEQENIRYRASLQIKLTKAKETEIKSNQDLIEAKLYRTELKLAVLVSSRQRNNLQLLEAKGTNREPAIQQEAKRLSKEIKELQKEKVELTRSLDQLKGKKIEFPVEHLSEQEIENELQQAESNTQANTIATEEITTENNELFRESQVSQGSVKQAVLVRIGKLNEELTVNAKDVSYSNELLAAAKISVLAKRAELIKQKLRDIEGNDTILLSEKAEISKVLRDLQNKNGLEQKAILQESKGNLEWATVIDPREDEPIDELIETAKKLTDRLENLKKEHQVVKSEIVVYRQEDQAFEQTQGPQFASTLEFLVQDVQRKKHEKGKNKEKKLENQNVDGDQEERGNKEDRNKGPVPPVPPKPPKGQENKGKDQGQNVGEDQEERGNKEDRNKGPVPPVPPKPPKGQENKGKDQGQNVGEDQEERGNKEDRNKGPVPPVPPKPPKGQENRGKDQGQNVGEDQEERGNKEDRNKGPVPPVPPKPPKGQENKGKDQGQNVGGDQEERGNKEDRNKGPVPPVPPKPPKGQENKGKDQGQNVGGDQEERGNKEDRNKGPVPPVPPKPPKGQENKGKDQGQNVGEDQEERGNKEDRNKGPVPPVPPKTTLVEDGTQTDQEKINTKKNKNKHKGQKNRQLDQVTESQTDVGEQTDPEKNGKENNKENNKRRNKRPAPPVPPKNIRLENERPKEKTTKDNGNNPRKGKNRNVGVNTEPAAIVRDEENQPNDKKKKRGLGRYFWHKNRNKRASRGIRWLRYLLNLWPIAAWPLCMTWMTVALPFQLIPVVMPAVIATFTAICLSYYLPKIIRFVRKRLLVRRAKKLGLDARSYVKQKEMERNQHNQNKVRKFFRRNWKTIAIILGVTALLGGIGLFLVPAVLGPILTASTISGLMALGGVALTGAAISITVQLFEKFGIVRLEKFFDKRYQQQKTNSREDNQKTMGNIFYDNRRHDPNLKKAFAELGNMSINLEKAGSVKEKKAKLSEITNKGIDKANVQNVKSIDPQKEKKKKEKTDKENKVVGL
ncbi:hypothetical protein [Enterococcus sp. AZ172]|uniref:hypothetical protein n=1 Tax=unclassified Enterococcus TaxID=2608891 RepID=UPI003F278F8F